MVTVNSVYNEMKQCLTNVHGELHQQKIATGNSFDALHSTITDEINGLDAIALRLSDVESDISHSSGIRKSLKDLQSEVQKVKETKINVQVEGDEVDYIQSKLEAIEKASDVQAFRIETITGILTHQQQQIDSLKLANAGNIANTIIDNVIIGGIAKSDNEVCRQKSAHFFMDRMDLQPRQEDILSAERMGKGVVKGDMEFPPLMKVRCSPFFHSLVWEHRQCLKGQRDAIYKWKFFVDLQRPDIFKAANNRYKPAVDKVLANNEGKEDKLKSIPKITGNKFFVNGEMQPDPVYVPSPQDLLCLSLEDRELLDNIVFEESAPYTLSDSTFKAFSSPISSYEDVKSAYKKIKLDNIYASHIMIACSFKSGASYEMFSCDDGEDGGGLTLEKIILSTQFNGYALFVIRWKLGGNMGARWFRCIESVAHKLIKKVKVKGELRRQPPVPVDNPPQSPAHRVPSSTPEAQSDNPSPQNSSQEDPPQV